MSVAARLEDVRRRIREAALRAGRDPEQVRLVAVSKRMGVERILEAAAAGQRLFGENYLQEARAKIERLDAGLGLEFHCIGPLQSNKAKAAASLFAMVETVDRIKIARALDRHAALQGRVLPVLLQVNVAGEPQKGLYVGSACPLRIPFWVLLIMLVGRAGI